MSQFEPKGLREYLGNEKFEEVKETFLKLTDNLKIVLIDGNIRLEKDGFLEAVSMLKFLKLNLEIDYQEKDSDEIWNYKIAGTMNDKGEWNENGVD